jgi:hypothetical protein
MYQEKQGKSYALNDKSGRITFNLMPAPIDVDHEAVKTHAIVHGIRDAARAFNLSEGTVTCWATREKWLEAPDQVPHQLPVTVRPRAVDAVKPSEAARRSLLGEKSRMRAAKVGDSMLRTIGKQKGLPQVILAQPFSQVVSSLAKVHGWDATTPNMTQVNINLRNVSVPEA